MSIAAGGLGSMQHSDWLGLIDGRRMRRYRGGVHPATKSLELGILSIALLENAAFFTPRSHPQAHHVQCPNSRDL